MENRIFSPNNVAALLLLLFLFSNLSVTTGGTGESSRKKTRQQSAPAEVHVPTIEEKSLETVMKEARIGRWDDYQIAQVNLGKAARTAKDNYRNARFTRIEYRKKEQVLCVSMRIDTLFSQLGDYVETHRRELAATYFVNYSHHFAGKELVDKVITEDIPVEITLRYNCWDAGREKETDTPDVGVERFGNRRELLEACDRSILDYRGTLDLEEQMRR